MIRERENLRPCLTFSFFERLPLFTQFLLLITRHLSLKIPHHSIQSMFGTITQLIINQNFQLFVGPIPVTWCIFYFSFLFSFNSRYPNSPNPVKKKKKKNSNSPNQVKEEEKKKKPRNPNPMKEERGKKKPANVDQ